MLRGYTEPLPVNTLLANLWKCFEADQSTQEQICELLADNAEITEAIIAESSKPVYGLSRTAENLGDAIARIGVMEVLKVVALRALEEFKGEPLTIYDSNWGEFMAESMGSALIMEFLAHDAELQPIQAYLCGLLHGVGKFPLMRLLQLIKPNAKAPHDMDFQRIARWERDEAGFDHSKLGGLMLDQWHYPEILVDTVSSHLHPMLGASGKKMACLLHLSRILLPIVRFPSHYNLYNVEIPLALLSVSGVRRGDIENCLPSVQVWLRNFLKAYLRSK